MVGPERPDWFSWTIAIVFHAELFVFAALLIDDEEVEYPMEREVHPVVMQNRPPHVDRFERLVDPEMDITTKFGRWPINCDHGPLLRAVRMGEDRLGEGLRCEVCGWPWWVIRASSW